MRRTPLYTPRSDKLQKTTTIGDAQQKQTTKKTISYREKQNPLLQREKIPSLTEKNKTLSYREKNPHHR